MSKKILVLIISILLVAGMDVAFLIKPVPGASEVNVAFSVSAMQDLDLQLFYKNSEMDDFQEDRSVTRHFSATDPDQIDFRIPTNAVSLRLDIDGCTDSVLIERVSVSWQKEAAELDLEDIAHNTANQMYIEQAEDHLRLIPQGDDPFIVWENGDAVFSLKEAAQAARHSAAQIITIVLANAAVLATASMMFGAVRGAVLPLLKRITLLRPLIWTAKEHWNAKGMVVQLASNDFKARFAGSILGAVWAFVTPLTTMLVFWFVFQVGLRNGDISGYPFIVWYAPAFLVWNFFAEAWSNATGSIREYSYLLRKVNYRTSITPTIKLLSSAVVHVAFILFIVILNLAYGIFPSVYNLQIIYYFICTMSLLFGLAMLCSALTPFLGDIPSVVGVILQIGFWATPIVWNADTMTPAVKAALQLNPMYYICIGYRDTFIDSVWFWERADLTLYFWCVSAFFVIVGCGVFKRMNSQFVDVL